MASEINMLITKRDEEILNFINEFGFCEIPQLETKFGFKKPRSYQIMQRLVKAGLVIHQRIFYGTHGIFYLTKTGAEYTDLPRIKNIPKEIYEHQLAIIKVYFKLIEKYPHAQWICERRIKREKFMADGIRAGKRRHHLADGMLVFPDNEQIAVEVELSMKSKKRLKEIILGYWMHKDIREVWYFCSPAVAAKVSKIADGWDHIKVFDLESWVKAPLI